MAAAGTWLSHADCMYKCLLGLKPELFDKCVYGDT